MTTHKKPDQHSNIIEDVDAISSDRGGVAGFFEMLLRRFRVGSYIIALIPLYIIAITAMGISATPSVYLFNFIFNQFTDF